jgi:probable phosphoglycerate mutase
MSSTRLVIIRHGLSQCSLDAVVGGIKGCTGLAAEGRSQVERLRDRLLRTGELRDADLAYTSVLPRAIETAEIVAPALGAAGESPAKQDADLSELDPGEADGLTWEAYRERYDVDMGLNRFQPMAPGGESIAEFLLRMARTLSRIVAEHPGQKVVIAAHGGVIWGSMAYFLNLPLRTPTMFDAENTSITEWSVDVDRATLVRFNDAAHLQPWDAS